MAHSAAAASRARFASELSRSRASSTYDDNAYATATGTSFQNAIQSTPQQHEHRGTQQGMQLHYDEMPSPGSMNSEEISIEIGRGARRGMDTRDDDVSSHAIFNMGDDDSRYEITATPPIPERNAHRRSLGGLRKEASLRRATEAYRAKDGPKRSLSGAKRRVVSEHLPVLHAQKEDDSLVQQESANISVQLAGRPSRFAASRAPSKKSSLIPSVFTANQGLAGAQATPRHEIVNNNITINSTAYTAEESFRLPNIPDLTELVSGRRKDGTPIFKGTSRSRSRFTSATYTVQPSSYIPVDTIPLPVEEKAIFSSLQLLKDRVNQLETEKLEAYQRAEEYMSEIVKLRSQASIGTSRPLSESGSDEDPTGQQYTSAISKLQTSVKSLQDRLDRSERKTSIAEITVKRVTNERDALVAQIGNAYHCNEELTKENETLKQSRDELFVEIEDLRSQVEMLTKENDRAREKYSRAKLSMKKQRGELEKVMGKRSGSMTSEDDPENIADGLQDVKSDPAEHIPSKKQHHASNSVAAANAVLDVEAEEGEGNQDKVQSLASRIELEIEKYRREKNIASRHAPSQETNDTEFGSKRRPSPREHQRPTDKNGAENVHKRTLSVPATDILEISDAEPVIPLDASRQPKQTKSRSWTRTTGPELCDRDDTILSDYNSHELFDLAKMRKKLEEEWRASRAAKSAQATQTSQSATQPGLPRKSSLKDLTSNVIDGVGQLSVGLTKSTKTVRLQSPDPADIHAQSTSNEGDTGNISVTSNTSRRRRRNSQMEGDTSAFIIPDITIHDTKPLAVSVGESCIAHHAASCTICVNDPQSIAITMPVPVTDRNVDLTDATIRPSESPALALATVIKHLADEVTHLKLKRESINKLYNQHDPALSRRRRLEVKAQLDSIMAEIERRSDQIYRLHDVVEGHKLQEMNAKTNGEDTKEMKQAEVEETLEDLENQSANLAGGHGRGSAPAVAIEIDENDSEDELPWEGISDDESEADRA